MALSNSSIGQNQNDASLTIIDPALLYRDTDQPISNSVVEHIRHVNQATRFDHNHDYLSVEHNLLVLAEQVEQVLNYYRQDLKQDSNTIVDSNQQLIIRLVDLIRPIYSLQRKKKLEDLSVLVEDISLLQAIPFIEQKDKIDQLNREIAYLKNLIITPPNHDDDRSIPAQINRINAMVDYDQWKEMEEETKKLQDLVITQRDKINELIKLISKEDEPSVSQKGPTTTSNNQVKPSAMGNINTSNAERPMIPPERLPLLSRLSSYGGNKKCPICSHEFDRTADNTELNTHIDKCLNSSAIYPKIPTRSAQYACPNCQQHFADDVYLEHVTKCLNGITDTD